MWKSQKRYRYESESENDSDIDVFFDILKQRQFAHKDVSFSLVMYTMNYVFCRMILDYIDKQESFTKNDFKHLRANVKHFIKANGIDDLDVDENLLILLKIQVFI